MARTVRVCTYNTHHGVGMDGRLDPERIAHVVERTDADVVALQEVDRSRERTDREDQYRRYADRLDGNAAYAMATAADDEGGDGGDGGDGGEPAPATGLGVFSRYRIESSERHGLPVEDGRESRALLETRVDVDGTPLSFSTTHFGISAADRRRQADATLSAIDGVDGTHVLVGDFNAAQDSEPIGLLTERYTDVFAAQGKREAFTHPSPFVERTGEDRYLKVYRPRTRADYVFATPDVTVTGCERRLSLASDHSALVADLVLS